MVSSCSPCQERLLLEGQAEIQLLQGGEENSGSQFHKPGPGTEPLLPYGQDRTLLKDQVHLQDHLEESIKGKNQTTEHII